MSSKQLFGGALVAAGLCVTGAQGQMFVHGAQGSSNFVGAYSGGFREFAISGDWNESEASGSAYALSAGDGTAITHIADPTGTGLAYTIHFNRVPFTVTSDTSVTVTWDFTGDIAGGNYIDSFFQIDSGNSGTIFFADLNNPVGQTQLNLSATDNYTWVGQVLAQTSMSSLSVVIPAPASMSLLGAAGLVAIRRRR